MNFENFLDKTGIIIATTSSFIFFVKLIYNLFVGRICDHKFNILRNFAGAFQPTNLILFICNIPIIFYAITICSTSVILTFTPMIIRCKEIHVKTFYISLVVFFLLASIVRYITISLLSNDDLDFDSVCIHSDNRKQNYRNNRNKISEKLKYYLYCISISPIVFDSTCFRRASEIIFSIFPSIYFTFLQSRTIATGIYILMSMVIVYFLQKKIKYVSHGIMTIFIIVLISAIFNMDRENINYLFQIPNNKFTIKGCLVSIFYADLFAIYVCDLFCICIEYVYIRYVERELIKTNIIPEEKRYQFYMFSSVLVAILALLWVLIFTNLGVTNLINTGNGFFMKIIKYSLAIMFIIQSLTNIYFLYDFIKLSNNIISYFTIPLVFVFNYFWHPCVSVINLIVYLISQLISCIELVRKL